MVATFLPTVVLSCAIGMVVIYCLLKQNKTDAKPSPEPVDEKNLTADPTYALPDQNKSGIAMSMMDNVCYAGVGGTK